MTETTSSPASKTEDATNAPFTPAERITELNAIDKSVSDLLSHAASTIDLLSAPPSKAENVNVKETFTASTTSFLDTLSGIEVQLRRNVYALEESGLIAPGNEMDGKKGATIASANTGTNGNGPLDGSWLNARARDGVGRSVATEGWAEMRRVVERVMERDAEVKKKGEDGNVSEKADVMDVELRALDG